MTNQSPTESLSFSQAIAATQSLIEQMKQNELSEVEIQQAVSFILKTKNGGRGFFVSYLTSDESLADNPSTGVINGLKSSVEVSSDLLVKNLAMSSAMIVAHSQNNDLQNVEGSKKVCQRTTNLIQQINSTSIQEKLQKLQTTINNGNGEYQEFFERWKYNSKQKKAIQAAISNTLKP